MKKLSLVGLKATDITATLAKDGAFVISSYNVPIGIVLPVHYDSKREMYSAFEQIVGELFDEQKQS